MILIKKYINKFYVIVFFFSPSLKMEVVNKNIIN